MGYLSEKQRREGSNFRKEQAEKLPKWFISCAQRTSKSAPWFAFKGLKYAEYLQQTSHGVVHAAWVYVIASSQKRKPFRNRPRRAAGGDQPARFHRGTSNATTGTDSRLALALESGLDSKPKLGR
jgi:hypothetical protein